MATEFTFQATPAEASTGTTARFDAPICYERRDQIHSNRWLLQGLSTRSDGPSDRGWLWLETSRSEDYLIAKLCADPEAGSLLAQGSADVSSLPVKVTLAPAEGQTLSGEFWIEAAREGVFVQPVLATLCTDEDLAEHWPDLEELGPEVLDDLYGLARYCAAATGNTLRLVSQLFPRMLGGVAARPDRNLPRAGRLFPDYRRIPAPEQLRQAAVFWALELALGARHQQSEPSIWSQLRDHYHRMRRKEIASWNLSFDQDPDGQSDSKVTASSCMTQPERI